jgi:hypothetical protein
MEQFWKIYGIETSVSPSFKNESPLFLPAQAVPAPRLFLKIKVLPHFATVCELAGISSNRFGLVPSKSP